MGWKGHGEDCCWCPRPPPCPPTHAGQAAVKVRQAHVGHGHGGAEQLQEGGREVRVGLERVGRSREKIGQTHVQQGAGIHTEAMTGQHGLQVVQVGVHGIQMVTELIPGPG